MRFISRLVAAGTDNEVPASSPGSGGFEVPADQGRNRAFLVGNGEHDGGLARSPERPVGGSAYAQMPDRSRCQRHSKPGGDQGNEAGGLADLLVDPRGESGLTAGADDWLVDRGGW